ncbi:Ig-like domain-containing protein [Agrobacterium vitis]|uniref:Ig-like domain-containing protein n=1 Tax=Agrobacterium vitis TaxID=373 RepID=UPI0015DA2890|nr:Ig-like domain-containing protein [Agrobacterium vitis]MCF1451176.1 LysM peptidoglycan-binding domain-containing protein [Agrobacterium vitis]BCH53825.1 peptidoglycan-binding protein LysM [Agrobacterium vitis]
MKNRAGWLALGVLAIATVLMVFFVLPQIGGTKKTAETPAAPAEQAAAPEASGPSSPTPAPDGQAAAKMQRLTKAAEQSVAALENLFADQKTPAPELYATARIAALTALKALSDADLPAGIESGLVDSLSKAKASAAHALQLIAKLPASPQDAAAMIANIGRAMRGEPEVAIDPDMPRFDVLRVEKDGSTVIAGSAAPGAKVEVHDGSSNIASATASPNGDFAIVLDKPLSPGDHSLDLKATTKEGKTIGSEEQATVSVPADPSGDVLAMVTKPGEASRLISGPQQDQVSPKDQSQPQAPEQINGVDKQGRVAAATPSTPTASPGSAPSPSLSAADLQITAVELEGDKIFVAGNAQKGRTVTAYADGKQIGSADVDQKGHFVVEGQMPLSVGQHIISVDLKDANGRVTLRASVPFNRPEGDQVAVVAPEAQPGVASSTVSPATVDSNLFDRQRDTLAKSFALLSNLFADGKTPTLESLAASRSALEFALKAVADFRPTPSTDQTASTFMARMADQADKALVVLKQVPTASVTAMANALPTLKSLVDAALEPMPAKIAAAQAAATQNPAPTLAPTDGTSPPVLSQAPLTESKNAVIIRRGDTLWQISRRVYGQGVRYTTIYVANAEQISNPDLIEPGQTFTVPDQSMPDDEAEKIHRKWMLEHKR